MNSKRILVFLALVFLEASGATAQSRIGEGVTVGVVYDGKTRGTDEFFARLRQDLTNLLGSRYDIQIPTEKTLDASWSAETARAHYARLSQDPNVDIILL